MGSVVIVGAEESGEGSASLLVGLVGAFVGPSCEEGLVDIKKLGKVPDGGGWKVLGRPGAGPSQKVGYEYVHSMVDDHTRMAYSEVLDAQDAQACAGFMLRAAHWFATWG